MTFSGIVDFRLKTFGADNSLNGIVGFGEVNGETLVRLKELSDQREIGIIMMNVEMLDSFRQLMKQANELDDIDEIEVDED